MNVLYTLKVAKKTPIQNKSTVKPGQKFTKLNEPVNKYTIRISMVYDLLGTSNGAAEEL